MDKNYTQAVEINAQSSAAFVAITKEIDKWWGSVDAITRTVGDEFTITFGEAYWTFRIIDWVDNMKVVWEVVDGQPELNNEWIGHTLFWTIDMLNNQHCKISLYQDGLTNELPCFDVCSTAWDRFILKSLK